MLKLRSSLQTHTSFLLLLLFNSVIISLLFSFHYFEPSTVVVALFTAVVTIGQLAIYLIAQLLLSK